ncbi:MAG: hypothetical protein GQ527_08585, partial [Bacteroidales bacterium]|nr:hypothetical protein [Bacteroidales bacterium]
METLLLGEFRPQMPDELYPIITSISKEKAITAIYDDSFVETKSFQELTAFDIINARNKTEVVLLNQADLGSYQIRVKDCNGEIIYSEKVHLKKGSQVFSVPPSGLIAFVKN